MTSRFIVMWRVIWWSSTFAFINAKKKINLNLEKCAFMVFSRLILGFIVSNERKIPTLRRFMQYWVCQYLQTHNRFKSLTVWLNFIDVSSRTFAFIMAPITRVKRKIKPFILTIVSKSLGSNQVKIHGSTTSDTSKLVVGVSCAHICIIIGNRCNVGTKPNW
jgi:hypothetical protein